MPNEKQAGALGMDSSENGKRYGCLFCKVGAEKAVAKDITDETLGVLAIVPERLRYRRNRGIATEETATLFPGYVFFETDDPEYRARELNKRRDVYRVLMTSEGEWKLSGSDRQFAERFFETNGVIGFSRVYKENDRIRVLDGYLKENEGKIIRVNMRARTAQVKVRFCDKDLEMWVGFELIEKSENGK